MAGSQIRAGRSLLGWRRRELAFAAGLHPNAVAYWERHENIPSPPDGDTPVACRTIIEALRINGVVLTSKPGPGVLFNPPLIEAGATRSNSPDPSKRVPRTVAAHRAERKSASVSGEQLLYAIQN